MTVHDRECIENIINNPLKKRLIEDVTETAQLYTSHIIIIYIYFLIIYTRLIIYL